MGWMVPLLYTARRRREESGEPCSGMWVLPLITVSLLVLGIALMVLLGIRLPAITMTLIIAGLVVLLALVALLGSLLR